MATFVVWSFARFALWSVYFSYLPAAFGFRNFGRINGVISILSALIGLLNYPLTAASIELQSFQPVQPVLGSLGGVQLLLGLFPFSLWLLRRQRRMRYRRQGTVRRRNEERGTRTGGQESMRLP